MQATSSIKSLKTYLKDWEDPDIAAYRLAVCLGLMLAGPPDNEFEPFRTAKSLFWTNNKLGNELYAFINTLSEMGILERNDEESQVRWNPSFKGLPTQK